MLVVVGFLMEQVYSRLVAGSSTVYVLVELSGVDEVPENHMIWRTSELVVHINSISRCPGSIVATSGSNVRVGASKTYMNIIFLMM